jgi:5-methylcytosine-specific restriction endonuclease McrA
VRETDAWWYAENRDRARETNAQWRAENPDKVRANNARYRARKYNALSEPYVRAEIFDAYENMCAYCRTEVTPDTGHLDHILPLSRGGVDTEMNLAPTCPACNWSKGKKTLMEWLGNSFNTDKDRMK